MWFLFDKLIEQLNECLFRLHRINEEDLKRSEHSREYNRHRKKIEKLLEHELFDRLPGFEVFINRLNDFFADSKDYMKDPDDLRMWQIQSIGSLIQNDLGEIQVLLSEDDDGDLTDAINHIQSFKEEHEIIQAGINALKLEEERRLLHKIDRANRSLFWFGESFEAIENNPFEIISILYDAFVKGVQWVSLEDIRRRCQGNHTIKDTDTSKAGIAEVFTVRHIDSLTKKKSRRKMNIWKIIETKGRKSPSYRLIDPREKMSD